MLRKFFSRRQLSSSSPSGGIFVGLSYCFFEPVSEERTTHNALLVCRAEGSMESRDDRIVVFNYPMLSCFWKMISVSDPNPVLVEIILSVSENYPKVYYDAQHTFLCFVYFASWGKITSGVILPSAEHDWLKQSHDKFGSHVLLSWTWHL